MTKVNTGSKQAIPGIIHYCWFGAKKIPRQMIRFIDGWKDFIPRLNLSNGRKKILLRDFLISIMHSATVSGQMHQISHGFLH
jgi:hypothetical protein